ncbi:Benzoate 4-monooxygenase [Podosphaera aphanis]|nr:Benzoate 4-monooxygenase [Podosphaera aphanis]
MGLLDSLWTPCAIVIALVLYHVVPYFSSYKDLRGIPGPLFARLSSFWLFYQARKGKRYLSVDQVHKQYGKLARIQPNHVSIADETAISAIYGHGNGLLKNEYYQNFVSGAPNTFNMRNPDDHTQRRKITSHVYSAKSISQLEVHVRENIALFAQQWDQLAAKAENGYAKIDCLLWFSLLSFDIVGDLAFGKPFGMLKKGDDIVELRKIPDGPPVYASTFQDLSKRGQASATLGCIPGLEKYAWYIPDPFFREGIAGIENLTRIALSSVKRRIEGKVDPDRTDILALLMQGRNSSGPQLSRAELNSEAVMLLFAGSDTVSNTACSILYYILHTAHVLPKLRAELDAALSDDIVVPNFEQVKYLPYLHNVINEAMRIYSTSSIGLPRDVPPGSGIHILGQYFPPGTVLSVPAYTIHHSAEIWGADVEEFVPERWERLTDRQKTAFIPFSHGPRSCIGRNLAMLELALFIATIIRRWDLKLYTEHLETIEGFLKKPIECLIGVKKR